MTSAGSKRKQLLKWGLAAAVLLAVVLVLLASLPPAGPLEPVYQGRRLSDWMEGHPNDYVPAVRAIGTNALPFLIAELQVQDSKIAHFGEELLAKSSMGAFWRTARDRHYRAGLALQILDTNAAPGLLEAIFSRPMGLNSEDPTAQLALALSWLSTPAASNCVQQRMVGELQHPDPMHRRNACLTYLFALPGQQEIAVLLAVRSADTNTAVRGAAVMAIHHWRAFDDLFIPALISRLDDDHAAIRRLAVGALRWRGTNAVAAVPALRAAYVAELSRPPSAYDPQLHVAADQLLPANLRSAIADALMDIDPGGPVP